MQYTELQITTNFSFLRGGSHPEELVEQAEALGYREIAITDRNTLAGIVRAHTAAKAKGMRILPAARLDLQDGPALLAYPVDKDAYARLSGLLTIGNLRAEKGDCLLCRADVYQHAKGIKFIVVPPAALNTTFDFDHAFLQTLGEYREAFGPELYLAASRAYQGDDNKQLYRLSQLSAQLNIPMAATNNVHYHHPARRQLQDVLTCIREKCTIQTAGFRLFENAERHLKPIHEMHRLFRQYPDALRQTQEIAQACRFSLDSLQYVYPEEITSEGRTPHGRTDLSYLAGRQAAIQRSGP
ncbi:PHP domain-containing protein [Chitinophaga sp. XS-30]|uniref:PHP domain-containing protein n=1 Tax=Chitinophaga sp. XS-30 TaxID=2604421 RepID=UPI001FEEEEAF|nr:PHP domain-containing protein [Chitinophaga sp. XS-30]